MDRTMAARAPAGRLGGVSRAGLVAGAARLGATLRAALAALRSRRRARIALICALIAIPLLGGGWLWFRHSSFVAVEHVRVSGAHGPQRRAIDAALTEAAEHMSTLDAGPAALRAAVAQFPQVSAISVHTSFPHTMRIVVIERSAVAALLVGGEKIAIGADGVALGTGVSTASLPTIADDVAPASGDRVDNTLVRQALTVLGAAPRALDRVATRAWFSKRGLTVAMRNGLLVYFGDATRPHAKWLALASVLAEPSAAGAIYIDVRTPERAAAGFAPGTGPQEAEGTGEGQLGKGETTVASIAERLAEATPEGRARAAGEAAGETSGESEASSESSEASSGEGEASRGGTGASSESSSGAESTASGGTEPGG